jgi:hypothetical protein
MSVTFKQVLFAATAALLMNGVTPAVAADEIPRAASTPQTPKNWRAPDYKIAAQAIVDRLIKAHPEVISITMHALPVGQPADAYTMIAGSFADRIGNTSSPGDIITAKKGVTQVESKWGTADYGKKVSIVLPIRVTSGDYIPVAMVVAFHQSPKTKKIDTDFMKPGIVIRNSLMREIPNIEALYAKVN